MTSERQRRIRMRIVRREQKRIREEQAFHDPRAAVISAEQKTTYLQRLKENAEHMKLTPPQEE